MVFSALIGNNASTAQTKGLRALDGVDKVAAARLTESAAGRKLFQQSCATCHGKAGNGTEVGRSLGARDLRSATVQSHGDGEFRKQIRDGKGNMPAFKALLPPAKIDLLVKYVRSMGHKK